MDSSSSSSCSRNKNPKLSVRNQTCFKRSKKTNLFLREETIRNKARELAILCENQVCVIHYDRNGDLVNTWPEDQSQVRDIAERFSRLTASEKLKKSTNLSQFLNKKFIDEKKRSPVKFVEMEGLLTDHRQILQDRLRELCHQTTTEPDQNGFISEQQNHNFPLSSSPIQNPSSWLIDDQQQTESSTNLLMSGDVSTSTEQDLFHSVFDTTFMFNHENATLPQLPDSVSSSFDLGLIPYDINLDTSLQGFNFGYDNNLGFNFGYDSTALLGTQGFGFGFGYDNNLSTQGFNFGYDNNFNTALLHGQQGFNFGHNSNLTTQDFGYNNNLSMALHGEQGFNFGYDNNLSTSHLINSSY